MPQPLRWSLPCSTHSENWFSPCPKAGSSLVQWCLQPIPSLPGQGFRTDLEGRCHWLTHWMTFWEPQVSLAPHPASTELNSEGLTWDTQLQLILNVATVTKTAIQSASQQMQEATQHWQLNQGSCRHSLQWKHKKQITLVAAWIGFRQIKVCWTCQGWAVSQRAEHCHRKCIILMPRGMHNPNICHPSHKTSHSLAWKSQVRWF